MERECSKDLLLSVGRKGNRRVWELGFYSITSLKPDIFGDDRLEGYCYPSTLWNRTLMEHSKLSNYRLSRSPEFGAISLRTIESYDNEYYMLDPRRSKRKSGTYFA